MDFTKILIFLVLLYLLQFILSTFQMKKFRKEYAQMLSEGLTGVGVQKGFFKGKVLMITLNSEGKVKKAKYMNGSTVFSKLKEIPTWETKSLLEIEENFVSKSMKNIFTKAFNQLADQYEFQYDQQMTKIESE